MKKALVFTSLAALLGLWAASLPGEEEKTPKPAQQPEQAAVERTRGTVKMLDDVYKRTIVLITDKYVNTEDDFPAGSAAVVLFKGLSEGKDQKVRLIDVTGDPYEPENVAKSEFEKKGVEQIKAGKDYYEEIVTVDGKPHLRAITPVPVVLKKCIMCHPHYAQAKQGEAIGAISYELPIR